MYHNILLIRNHRTCDRKIVKLYMNTTHKHQKTINYTDIPKSVAKPLPEMNDEVDTNPRTICWKNTIEYVILR